MSQWSRPYVRHLINGPWHAAAVSVFLWVFVLCLVGRIQWPGSAAFIALALIAQAFVWRMATMGLFVGAPGIRVRYLFHTALVPWQDVDRVLIDSDPWFRNRLIFVITRDGQRIPTPMCEYPLVWLLGPLANRVYLSADKLDSLADKLDQMARSGGASMDSR